MDMRLWFRNICLKNQFPVSDTQLLRLEEYVSSLLEWNKKINLVSRRDTDNIWRRHIVGSIAFLFRFQLHPSSSIIDIGTGGGLPGIPLAILLQNVRVTLVDSIQKKVKAVESIISDLHLETVDALCGRAEELADRKELQHSFDYVIARAVGQVADLIKWSKPFLKSARNNYSNISRSSSLQSQIDSGSILLLKGGDVTDEI